MGIRQWFSSIFEPADRPDKSVQSDGPVPGSDDAVKPTQSPSGVVATLDPPLGDDNQATSETVEEQPSCWWAPRGVTLIDPAAPELIDRCGEARALENHLVSFFDGHDLTLPPLPLVPQRVLKRLREPNCSAARLAAEIADDQVVAAEVIRIANSPMYRGVDKITALRPAVTRLGMTAIRTLMMHYSLRAATFGRKGVDQELAAVLWYRSVAGAFIMRGLAAFTTIEEDDAFLLGLLHDIGNVIVLRIVDQQYALTRYHVDIDTFEYLCHQAHQEFGELIAESWQLPDTLKSLISDHHSWPAPDDPFVTERRMLLLTDMIGQMLGYGSPASYALLDTPAVRELGLAERQDFVQFLAGLPEELETTLASYGMTTGLHKLPDQDSSTQGWLAGWLSRVRRGRTHAKSELGRRQHPRWSTSREEVEVWLDQKRYPALLRVADLSEGGMKLLFPEQLQIGQSVRTGRDGNVEGSVVYASENPDESGLYEVGIKFSR